LEFKINDAMYAYEIYGQGTPLVMLHGFTGSMKTWHPFINCWEDSFQLFLIDLPGHGKTRVNTPRSMEQCSKELKALFEHLNLSSIHLLGYSMGGRTALSFAMYYPEMVETLVLESASPGLKSVGERLKRIEKDDQLAKRIESEGLTSFVNYWESIPLFKTQKNLSKDAQQVIRNERLWQSSEGLAESLRTMGTGSQPSWWNQLTELKCPVLLLTGKLDEKFILINQQMTKLLPRSEFQIISNAGHAIHVEQPEIIGKIVKEFIVNQQSNC